MRIPPGSPYAFLPGSPDAEEPAKVAGTWVTVTQVLPVRRELSGQEDLERLYLPEGDQLLRINFIASLDGVVEIEGRSGALGGPGDRSAFAAMRAVTDVVLVGAGTARAENYGPLTAAPDVAGRRRRRGQSPRPTLAVVTRRGDLDGRSRLFGGEDRVLVLTTDQVEAGRPDLAEVAEVVSCGRSEVDMDRAVGELRRRGLGRILCEGGPALARTLLDAGLVDELCLTISPVVLGGGRRLFGEQQLARAGGFELAAILEADSMLLARYRLRRGDP